MKKLLGITLIAWPLVALYVFAGLTSSFLMATGAFALAGVILGTVFIGTGLLLNEYHGDGQ